MKTIKTIIPEGWEIDKEKSTFEEIVLKQSKKELPKTWEELEGLSGWYVTSSAEIKEYAPPMTEHDRNTFVTESQAKASIALAQLSQLREVYRDGWKPENNNEQYSIIFYNNQLVIVRNSTRACFLSFQSHKMADKFLTNCRYKIIQAAPLLFGEEIK
jgi:hypothetical protein